MFGHSLGMVGGTVCMVLGWAGAFIGMEELRVALHCSGEPRQFSCRELDNRGPGPNSYVSLTDYVARWDGSLTWSDSDGGPWTSVTVPLAPAGSAGRPQDVRAIITFTRVRNSQELRRALAAGRLTGLVKSRGSCYGQEYLLQRNPGLPLDRCWVIWEGTKAWAPGAAGALAGGSVLLFALGMLLVVGAARAGAQPNPGTRAVVTFMVPLAAVLDGLARWCRGRRWLTPTVQAVLLLGAGLPLVGAGAVLAVQRGLFSLESMNGPLLGGSVMVNFGVGFTLLGLAAALRAGREPVPAADDGGPEAPGGEPEPAGAARA